MPRSPRGAVLYRTDSVLDVADIDRFADGIGSDVTKIRIPSGVHDLVLSAKAVRENVYQELFDWIRSRGWLEDDRGQSRINPVQSGAA